LTNKSFNKNENSSRAEVVTERLLSDSLDDVQRPITKIHANPLNSVIIQVELFVDHNAVVFESCKYKSHDQ